MLEIETVERLFEGLSLIIDVIGIGIILWGFSLSLKDFIVLELSKSSSLDFFRGTQLLRCQLGTYLLLGLEFMIASDIIHTFFSRSNEDLMYLGTIIVIRTTISYFLGKEMQEVHRDSVA